MKLAILLISIKYRLLSKTLRAWGSPGIDPRGLKFLGGHRGVYLQKICVNEGDCSIFTETGPTLIVTDSNVRKSRFCTFPDTIILPVNGNYRKLPREFLVIPGNSR